MSYETIEYSVVNNVGVITLNKPEKLNAICKTMLQELKSVVRTANSQKSSERCLLITGSGRGFCAGADLNSKLDDGLDSGSNLLDNYHPLLLELAHSHIPIVTAINGIAAGAGMSLALIGDITIAGKSASFLQAFVNIGLIPDAGSSFMLPRLIGPAKARAMMMLGEKVDATTAESWGMIYKVVEDDTLMNEAMAIATRMASGPTIALSNIRKLVAQSATASFETQIQNEAISQRQCNQTEDCKEGVSAFLEKRKAEFKGK